MREKKLSTTDANNKSDKKSSRRQANNGNIKIISQDKKKKIIIVSMVCGVILLIMAITIAFSFKKNSDIATSKIMSSLSKRITSITDVVNYSEANDPNGIMGQPNQYTSKSSWEDGRITDHVSEYAGTIEVFNNTKDAELREWKINKTAEACEQRFTKEKYGNVFMDGFNCKEYNVFRKNTVIIRLSSSFSEKQISEYIKAFDSIIDSYEIPEKDIPTTEQINNLRREIEESIVATIAETEKDAQKGLDEVIASYEDKLNGILESLDEEEFTSAKEELKTFKEASYYSSKIARLEQKINDIENKIANKKKQAEAAAARAEYERLAKKNRTLGTGRYVTCTDIDSGTYDTKAISGSGNLFVDSDSYSHYVNEVMNATGAYGWTTEYKNMVLSCGDVLEIKNGLTVQLTAKK